MRINLFITLILSCVLTACSRWNVEPKTTASSPSTGQNQPVYSQGQSTIAGRKGFDLDAGKGLDDGSAPADFYWNVEQIGRTTRAELFAHNKASFTITTIDPAVFDTRTALTLYPTLVKQTFSDNSISTDASIPIRLGSVLAYRTNDSRYGLFRVDKLAADLTLTLTWITFTK